jgi:uncharacterized protein YjlB
MEISIPIRPKEVVHHIISPQKYFPNNKYLPLLIYRSVFNVNTLSRTGIKNLLEQNLWGNTWVDSVYDFHHYHSNTHEALIVLAGWCDVIYGGPNGKIYKISEGDVVIHPAGVSHKKEMSSESFACLGGYPNSIDFDMRYGKKNEHPEVDFNIEKVRLPLKDPVYGQNGIIFEYWI